MFKFLARLFGRRPPAVKKSDPPAAPKASAAAPVPRTTAVVRSAPPPPPPPPPSPPPIRRGSSPRTGDTSERRNTDSGISSPLHPLNPLNSFANTTSYDEPTRSSCHGYSSSDSYSSSSSSDRTTSATAAQPTKPDSWFPRPHRQMPGQSHGWVWSPAPGI